MARSQTELTDIPCPRTHPPHTLTHGTLSTAFPTKCAEQTLTSTVANTRAQLRSPRMLCGSDTFSCSVYFCTLGAPSESRSVWGLNAGGKVAL